MKINYDVKLPPRSYFGGTRTKSEETIAIDAFLEGAQKNMEFQYDTPDEAKKRLGSIQGSRRKSENGVLYDLYRSGSSLYIVRLSPAEVKKLRAKREATAKSKGGGAYGRK